MHGTCMLIMDEKSTRFGFLFGTGCKTKIKTHMYGTLLVLLDVLDEYLAVTCSPHKARTKGQMVDVSNCVLQSHSQMVQLVLAEHWLALTGRHVVASEHHELLSAPVIASVPIDV